MNALVIFTYPGVENYLHSLVSSINEQTGRDFTVFFVNDGLRNINDHVRDLEVSSNIITVEGTPYKNRVLGLKKLSELNVENLIFQDADDLMAPNRIEECLKYLENNSFVVNDLDLINQEGEIIEEKYWSIRLDHESVFSYDFISRYNLLGFTNTAIKGELLEFLPEYKNERIIAADWFIFYRLLHQSETRVRFINSTTSLYRQHSQNVTGLGGLNESRLQQAIDVKRRHYKSLDSAGYDVEDELNRILKIEKATKHEFKRNSNPHLFWWEETEYVL